MKKLISLILLLPVAAFGKTLKSILVLPPPTTGYRINSLTGTLQLTTQCTYDDDTTDNCSGITLTWGSSGLATANNGSSGTYFGPEAYAYDPITGVLGHHIVNIDTTVITTLNSSPAPDSHIGAYFNVVTGTTVLASAFNPDTSGGVGTNCAWSSSNTAVATVNNIGEVTGVAPGTVTITCYISGVHVDKSITVVSPTLANHTFYARPDGGTRYDATLLPSGQCDGSVDVAYSGGVVNHKCAFSNPEWAFTDNVSTTTYTGAFQPGDTLIIDKAPARYQVGGGWNTQNYGSIFIPSGTPAQHSRILGSNYASCGSTALETGLESYNEYTAFDLRGVQNVDISCIDLGNDADCNGNLTGGFIDFPCPNGIKPVYPYVINDYTANLTFQNDYTHGFTNGLVGTPGPGLVVKNSSFRYNDQAGLNLDDPFGAPGVEADGIAADGLDSSYSGCTEEIPKILTSVSRDGSGNLNVAFNDPIVNYVVGTNLVLSGMTPSDLNGTYPVTAITFDQETVNITGGSCAVETSLVPYRCDFTTSTAPTFVQGRFVNIAGATPSWLNGKYEVYASSSTGFSVIASPVTRLGWSATTISNGGTAASASSLVASAAGASESASVLGSAGHVIPAHRCLDQADNANGDGVGTGGASIGTYSATNSTFKDNLQDGWDMLHSAMVKSTFTRNVSSGNEGAPAKFGNADVGVFDSNILIGNGGSLIAFNADKPPDFNQYLGMPYRAADSFPIGSRIWSRIVISNNTFDGGFPTLVDDICTDSVPCTTLQATSVPKFLMQNNVFVGFSDSNAPGYSGPSYPGLYAGSTQHSGPANWTWTNNMAFNLRNFPGAGTLSGNQFTTNPLLVTIIPDITTFAGESVALTFNMGLTATSPAIHAGVSNADVPATDNVNHAFSNPPSMGALEYITNIIRHLFGGSSSISGSGSIN
jgi:hypothetical protein